jgi:D-alanyl-D-alanine carboxypeptidase (penicillin-binding protein 5/6)
VADLDTGAVLVACGAHEFHPPASVQKLLLCATMLPKLDPARVVEVTREDLDIEPHSSAVGLLEGGHYPVETLWLGLLLESGNDAANVLARLGGGDAGLAGGLAAMNAQAHWLGAYDTHAVTSSGLDGTGQFTSVYDLALIARADFARDDFRRYDTTLQAQIPPQPPRDPRGFQIQNENKLLTRYPGALGGKTGYTDKARHTYVGAAQRNGRRLVVTLLDGEAYPVRLWQQGATLLDWGFTLPAGVSVGHLVTPDEVERLRQTPTPRPAPSVAATAPGAADTPVRRQSFIGIDVSWVAVAVAAVPLLVIAVVGLSLVRRAAVRSATRRRPRVRR